MMLSDLAVAAGKSGLVVREVAGWATRGHGSMSGVRSIVCHHTAGAKTGDMGSLAVVRDGREGLPGPLAQLALSRSGVVYVVAAGLSYHAGVTFFPTTQGNSWSIGIEAEATGVDPWPTGQYVAYVRLVRALIDHYGLSIAAVYGHKEVAKPLGRKSDPNFDMAKFRRDVAALTPVPPPVVEGSLFVSLTPTEEKALLRSVLATEKEIAKMKPGVPYPARSPNCRVASDDQYGHTMSAEAEAADAYAEVKKLRAEVAAMRADLDSRLQPQAVVSDEAMRAIAVMVSDEIARRQAQ